ncbi:hypothetical protein RKLH11_1525 [Rhodobacteraceae bacterium KLH11]|nr:hypothetical protein RKLH11_1525 [Rhodobacteraceae bacterium KLH11]
MFRRSSVITRKLTEALLDTGVVNLFNPSIQATAEGYSAAFRGLAKGAQKPFDSFLVHFDSDCAPLGRAISLGELFRSQIGTHVCDPKLFRIGGRCWVTFNTGHFERPNRIFVAVIGPELGPLLEVDYPDRTEVEKNWAFFEQEGKIHALYDACPTVILREKSRLDGKIIFERVTDWDSKQDASNQKATKQPKVTIGTPLELLDPMRNLYGFIGHRRWYWRGKRLYLGSPMTLKLDAEGAHIHTTSHIWTHSLRSMLGDQTKHNPNLISCTYFSGLSVTADKVLVSYGINDVDFSLAEMPLTWWSKQTAKNSNRGM